MAVIVTTSKPRQLLASIKGGIDDGSITAWEYDKDGDFTLTSEHWKHHAWLRPRITDDGLVFNALAPKGQRMSRSDYAVFHGRFTEMLLEHFDTAFTLARATAMAHTGDLLGP